MKVLLVGEGASELAGALKCSVSRQRSPEALQHPKETCRQLLDQSEVDLAQAVLYAELAAIIDLASLEARCKKGFAPFANRVREM